MSSFYIKNGNLWATGCNENDQLGINNYNYLQDYVPSLYVFTQVFLKFKVKNISCCDDHTFITDENGYLWSCGNNDHGQLGLNFVGNFFCEQIFKKVPLKFTVTNV